MACGNVGGFYQKVYQTPPPESLAGSYMLSVQSRFTTVSLVVLAGNANGSAFHTIAGTFDRSGSRFTVAFPSGAMNGTLKDERITWDGGDVWQLQATPAFQLAAAVGGSLVGMYTDPTHYQAGSFAGTSIVSFDGPGRFTMVGSDDGLDFWSVRGNFTPASGAVVVNLSPLGGESSVDGTFAKGTLRLGAQRVWEAQEATAQGTGEATGYVAVVIAVLFFGTNFVPVKRFETGDGMFFQWVMCSAIFCWGLMLQLVLFALHSSADCVPGVGGCRAALANGRVDAYAVKFIPQAAAGGALWATGNTMAVPIIRSIGLGMGMLIWGTTNMLMGWATGMARLDRNTASPGLVWLNVAGVSLAVLALGLYTLIRPDAAKEHPTAMRDELLLQAGSAPRLEGGVLGAGTVVGDARPTRRSRRLSGIFMAVLSGVLYGNNFTPPNLLLNTGQGPSNALDYVFSHFCGIYFTSTVWMLAYCCYKRSAPVLYPCVILPGFISGLMWAAAQTAWFVANTSLSVAVAFPLITSGPGIVSSLWGVFVFKEIAGRRNFIVLGAAISLAVTGCVLIGVAKAMP